MKRLMSVLLLCSLLAAASSCTEREILDGTQEVCRGISLQIGDYPSFSDSKTIGTPDEGKSVWSEGDTILIVLQTAEDSMAVLTPVIYRSEAWKTESALTLPSSPCRALAFYAPAYEFGSDRMISLKNGRVAGLDEFFSWTSGEDYDITDPSAVLKINFERTYSRLRLACTGNYTVRMESEKFTPAGYRCSELGSGVKLEGTADSCGNAFFYGNWADGAAFSFSAYDTGGKYSFSEYFSSRPASEAGKSYAVSLMDDGTYTKLSALAAKATIRSRSFNVKVKNAVVSYAIGSYAYLEDESGALMVNADKHGLSEGQRITGTISGSIKLNRNTPEITALNCSGAAVTSDGAIPCTEMTIAQLNADFDAALSRRVLLRNITVERGISSGSQSSRTGQISQDGSTMTIYGKYSASPAEIAEGLSGNLIAFPCYQNYTRELLVYESSHFSENGGEDTPFTRLTLMGSYSGTDTQAPIAVRTYVEGSDQYSCSKSSSARGWRMFNMESGSYMMMDLACADFGVGSTLNATVKTESGTQSDCSLTVVKKTSSAAWLEDKTDHTGYVIAIQ